MTQDDGAYDLKPPEPPAAGAAASGAPDPAGLKPGDPGWVPPVPIIEKADDAADEPPGPPPDPDIEKYKGVAIIGYVCFLIPLLSAPNSKYVRFHANQALLVFIGLVAAVGTVIALQVGLILKTWIFKSMEIGILDLFFGCGFHLLQAAALVGWAALVITGMIHAANGEKKELPVVGHWTLIKEQP